VKHALFGQLPKLDSVTQNRLAIPAHGLGLSPIWTVPENLLSDIYLLGCFICPFQNSRVFPESCIVQNTLWFGQLVLFSCSFPVPFPNPRYDITPTTNMAPRDAATLPSFQINDNPVLSRFPTFATKNGSSPTPDDTWPDNPSLPHVGSLRVDAETPSLARCMEKRLRQNMVALPNSKSSRNKFWPGKLFDHLFQQSDVLQLVGELKRQGWLGTVDEKSLQDWAKKVGQRYRRVFALLILTGAEAYLLDFVKASIDDSRLPLDRDAADLGQILGTYWHLDSICVIYQWQLVVDFFELAPPGDVHQVRLHEESIRPWCQHQVKRSREETRHGSYGEVRQIKIHPWQHNFGPTLEKAGLTRVQWPPFDCTSNKLICSSRLNQTCSH